MLAKLGVGQKHEKKNNQKGCLRQPNKVEVAAPANAPGSEASNLELPKATAGSREDIAPPESFHEQINPAVADSDALLAAIPKSETRDLETSSSRSTEQKSATAAKLASLRIDKDFRELQGGNAGTPNAKSFIPKQFSKARAFSFPAECTRIPKNPTWLIRWHSSNCRLSSETAALTKETTPLSDRKVHFRRQSCFTLGQPLPTASIPKSVTPWQAVITRDLNFFKPRPEPMTQKPLSFMF
nr:hypothetical protein Itr_chr10CG17860 [Ipomoea trifida]